MRTDIRETNRAVSPVVGAILMVAVTVLLSATIGMFVLDLSSPTDPGDTESSVRIDETAEGVDITPVTLESTIRIKYEGTIYHTFESGDVGQTVTVPAGPGETVTAITVSDSGKHTVLTSHTVKSNENLIGYYLLDEAAGSTTTVDSSWNHANGSPNAVTLGVDGVVGTAYAINGNGSFVDLPSTTAVNSDEDGYRERTVTVWFQANTTADRHVIWEQGGAANGMNIYLYSGNVYVGYWGNGQNWLNTSVPDNGWHSVTVVIEDADTIRGYLDGQEFDSGPANRLPYGPNAPGIGAQNSHSYYHDIGGDTSSHSEYAFEGRIDQLRLYDYALSPAEVQRLYEWGNTTAG